VEKRAVLHRIPPHRFYSKEAGAAAQLVLAQSKYDAHCAAAPLETKIVDKAFVKLHSIGYPNAGMNGADANVVARWYRVAAEGKTEWAALVKCMCFQGAPIGVIVFAPLPTGTMPDHIGFMKEFAGRDAFRNKFLLPQIHCIFPAADR
jgi:hypothetical protein